MYGYEDTYIDQASLKVHLKRRVEEVARSCGLHEVGSGDRGTERLLSQPHQTRYTGYLLDKPV